MTIRVYIDNGQVWEYEVKDQMAARDHVDAIIKTGYRHNDGKGDFIAYPAHRISKVRILGIVDTLYPDTPSGT
jgi:hypothetical protein